MTPDSCCTRIIISSVFLLCIVGTNGRTEAQSFHTVRRGQPIVLFDGRSLNGWSRANGQASDGWVVDDGALHRIKRGGDLYHKNTFRDFELHFQWKIGTGGNSGVKYRVRKYGKQWMGCEYQLLDDQNEGNPKHTSGALYGVIAPTPNKPQVLPYTWHLAKIVVCGNAIEHWLDGQRIVSVTVGDDRWVNKIQNSKFRDKPNFGENREGRIFFQDHGHPVWFRNVILVPLYCNEKISIASVQPNCNIQSSVQSCGGTPRTLRLRDRILRRRCR